jgi:hypothetical protein
MLLARTAEYIASRFISPLHKFRIVLHDRPIGDLAKIRSAALSHVKKHEPAIFAQKWRRIILWLMSEQSESHPWRLQNHNLCALICFHHYENDDRKSAKWTYREIDLWSCTVVRLC